MQSKSQAPKKANTNKNARPLDAISAGRGRGSEKVYPDKLDIVGVTCPVTDANRDFYDEDAARELSELLKDPNGFLVNYRDEDRRALVLNTMESLLHIGQQNNVSVYRRGSAYYVTKGRHRAVYALLITRMLRGDVFIALLRGAIADWRQRNPGVNEFLLSAQVEMTKDPETVTLASVADNMLRRALTPREVYSYACQLATSYEMRGEKPNVERIKSSVGARSVAEAKNMLALREMHADAARAVFDHGVAMGSVLRYRSLPEEEQGERIRALIASGDTSAAAVAADLAARNRAIETQNDAVQGPVTEGGLGDAVDRVADGAARADRPHVEAAEKMPSDDQGAGDSDEGVPAAKPAGKSRPAWTAASVRRFVEWCAGEGRAVDPSLKLLVDLMKVGPDNVAPGRFKAIPGLADYLKTR